MLGRTDFKAFYVWNTFAFLAVASFGLLLADVFYGYPSFNAEIFTFLTESYRRIPSLGLECGTDDVQWCPYYLTGICLGLLVLELIISCIEFGCCSGSRGYEMASTNNRKKRRRNRNRTETRFWIILYVRNQYIKNCNHNQSIKTGCENHDCKDLDYNNFNFICIILND